MDAQIHGAIVEGILAGVFGGMTVVGGVVLDIRLRARRDRQQRFATAVEELSRLNTSAGLALSRGDDFVEGHRDLIERIHLVRRLAEGDTAPAVREACADLSDMWTALLLRGSRGIRVSDGDLITTSAPIHRIYQALGLIIEPIEGTGIGSPRLGRYIDHGIDSPEFGSPSRPPDSSP